MYITMRWDADFITRMSWEGEKWRRERTNLVQAAILDVNLSDRDVTPIAELLIGGGVPVIFYSGLALPAALRERYPSACVLQETHSACAALKQAGCVDA